MMRFSMVLLMVASVARAEDWPQFRGGQGDGVSTEKGLPVNWSATEGHRWKVTLPARGVSSPVVANGRVYITCSSGTRDDRLHTLAYDANTGTLLWHRQLAATGGTLCHPMTCMAAPTPVADATGVYALFATGDMAAYDADGTLRWYRSFVGDYPTITNQVGAAASPILYEGKVIVPMDNAGESFLAALDSRTGKNLWKIARKREINWITPVVRKTGGTPELLLPMGTELVAYNAETGEKIWSHAGDGGSGIPTPSAVDGVIYLPSRGVTALKTEGGKAKTLWKTPKLQTGMSSPLVYDGYVYGAGGGGLVAVADAKTGTIALNERLYKGKCSASPLAGDGKIYITNETGTTVVMKAGPSGEILATNDIGEETLATPAISGTAIYLRTKTTLYCIGSK